MKIITSALTAIVVLGIELTKDTWLAETTGRTVFVKFFVPWCGHCKEMAPAWDQLAKSFEKSSSTMVAEVDCDGAGADLCKEMGVENYPTLKYGHPGDLQEYEGGFEYEELLVFASENIGPVCSPESLELCDAGQEARIKILQAQGIEKLEKDIDETHERIAKAETRFNNKLLEIHQSTEKEYNELLKEKELALENIEGSKDLRIMNVVLDYLSDPEVEH